MHKQTEKIVEIFQTMVRRDLAVLEFWQNFDPENMQETAVSTDDLTAEIPESLSSGEDFEKLKEIALETMLFCQKKKVLLDKIAAELKDFDGI